MTLPPRLRRWWPLFKRAHRLTTRSAGFVFRCFAPLAGARRLPRSATERSIDTVAGSAGTVTLHPARTGVDLHRPETQGDPADHWVFVEGRTAYTEVPDSFTLDLTEGRLVGDFAATVTRDGVLDHETSTYFGVFDWREHPIFLRPTLGQLEQVPGTVLSLAARGTNGNYYHFLYDAIARYGVFEESGVEARIDAVVVAHGAGYQRQLLELAGIPGPYLQPERGKTYCADRLLVPSNPNWALQAPPAMVDWLRKRLPPKDPPRRPQRLYLTRGRAPHTRRVVEEEQLLPELERRGFVRLDPGTLSVQQQIDIFSAAEVIVAPHGAGLTNVTFSPPGVRVLEMFPSSYVHRGLWAICQAIGGHYRYLVADMPKRPHRSNAGIADDVSIPVRRVLAAIDALLDS